MLDLRTDRGLSPALLIIEWALRWLSFSFCYGRTWPSIGCMTILLNGIQCLALQSLYYGSHLGIHSCRLSGLALATLCYILPKSRSSTCCISIFAATSISPCLVARASLHSSPIFSRVLPFVSEKKGHHRAEDVHGDEHVVVTPFDFLIQAPQA